MPIASMTGFARGEGEFKEYSWRWEVRSVNNRGLDLRVRMPPGMEAFEIAVRDQAAKRFRRGSFSISLNLTRSPGLSGYRLNERLLERAISIAEAVRARTGSPPPQVDGLLRLRGVLEPEEPEDSDEERAAREVAMIESLGRTLDAVARARIEEGAHLQGALLGLISEIAALTGRARTLASLQPEAICARVTAQIAELLAQAPSMAEERLAQEVALLVGKADVREEIDRLDAHVVQAREIVEEGGSIGRRLDFLAQELNREANTLCSKAQDIELTRIGLALKAAIEQFREQVQNIE